MSLEGTQQYYRCITQVHIIDMNLGTLKITLIWRTMNLDST